MSVPQHQCVRFQREIDRNSVASQFLRARSPGHPGQACRRRQAPFPRPPSEQCSQAGNHRIRTTASSAIRSKEARALVKSGGVLSNHANAASLFASIAPKGCTQFMHETSRHRIMAAGRPSRRAVPRQYAGETSIEELSSPRQASGATLAVISAYGRLDRKRLKRRSVRRTRIRSRAARRRARPESKIEHRPLPLPQSSGDGASELRTRRGHVLSKRTNADGVEKSEGDIVRCDDSQSQPTHERCHGSDAQADGGVDRDTRSWCDPCPSTAHRDNGQWQAAVRDQVEPAGGSSIPHRGDPSRKTTRKGEGVWDGDQSREKKAARECQQSVPAQYPEFRKQERPRLCHVFDQKAA